MRQGRTGETHRHCLPQSLGSEGRGLTLSYFRARSGPSAVPQLPFLCVSELYRLSPSLQGQLNSVTRRFSTVALLLPELHRCKVSVPGHHIFPTTMNCPQTKMNPSSSLLRRKLKSV